MFFKINNPTDYKVAMYIRLSKEDEDKKEESQSVTNQRSLIISFIKENNLNLVGTYIDDGVSGTTFDRPEFNKMIEDINNRKINMVITKDLSRLGRDHIETGNLLEKYFPTHNIRYVAINDNYDSLEDDSSANDIAPFKNVFNDMYAKDISKKVRTALHTKQLNGEFIGTNAPIGYIKDKDNKHKLVIDKNTSYIVKRIFREFLDGKRNKHHLQKFNKR